MNPINPISSWFGALSRHFGKAMAVFAGKPAANAPPDRRQPEGSVESPAAAASGASHDDIRPAAASEVGEALVHDAGEPEPAATTSSATLEPASLAAHRTAPKSPKPSKRKTTKTPASSPPGPAAGQTCPALAADPGLEALRAKVAAMETRVINLEATKAELEQLIEEYACCQYRALGSLIGEQLRLQRELSRQVAERSSSPQDQQAAEAAAREYAAYQQALEETPAPPADLADDQREELKALYRATVMLCHPDRVDEAAKLMAHEIFLRTQDAYRRRDLDALRLISRQLAAGNTKSPGNSGSAPREHQEALMESLLDKGTELLMAIQSIKMQPAYRRARHREQWEDHFSEAREGLENQCAALRRQLSS